MKFNTIISQVSRVRFSVKHDQNVMPFITMKINVISFNLIFQGTWKPYAY